jgi:hypothetical protein
VRRSTVENAVAGFADSVLQNRESIFNEAELIMIFLSIFTDDQTAILGCFGAIAVCGLIAALSFRLGPAGKPQSTQQTTIRITRTATSESTKSKDRRAA